MADVLARSIAINASRREPHWGYNLAAGLAAYRRALASYGSSLVRVHCIGDSLTLGYNSQDKDTDAWPIVVAGALQSRYGTGGFGFAQCDATPATSGVSFSWGYPGSGWSVGAASVYTHLCTPYTVSTTSGTVTTATSGSVSGATGITFSYLVFSGGGTATVTVDGVNKGTINCGGAAGAAELAITGLTTASHTVVITPAGNGVVTINGVWLDTGATSGVIVSKMGVGGTRASDWVNLGLGASLWANHPAQLVVIGIGANDFDSSVTTSSLPTVISNYKSGMGQLISYWQGTGASVLLVTWFRPADTWSKFWAEQVQAQYDLADQYNCGLMDLFQACHESYEIVANIYQFTGYLAAPTMAPTVSAVTGTGTLPTGTYTCALTYKNATGETALGPTTTVTLTAGQVIQWAPPAMPTGMLTPSVELYISQTAGTTMPLGQAANATATGNVNVTAPANTTQPPSSNGTANTIHAGTNGYLWAARLIEPALVLPR